MEAKWSPKLLNAWVVGKIFWACLATSTSATSARLTPLEGKQDAVRECVRNRTPPPIKAFGHTLFPAFKLCKTKKICQHSRSYWRLETQTHTITTITSIEVPITENSNSRGLKDLKLKTSSIITISLALSRYYPKHSVLNTGNCRYHLNGNHSFTCIYHLSLF